MIDYFLLENWPRLPGGFKLGNPTGLSIDAEQNIFIFHRAGREWISMYTMPDTYISSETILMLDRDSGRLLNKWGDNIFIMPHGLTVDFQNNIWVTDVGLHQVFKFSNDGKLLMKLGESKVSGNDSAHFNHPTDVAVRKDGAFYVSDGYGNSRVVKFSSTGQYLFEWGNKGNKEGEFNLPHAIDLDSDENINVADRENCRVQLFTSEGKFLKQWKNESHRKISSLVFDKGANRFVATDYAISESDKILGSEIILFNSLGNVSSKFGKKEGFKCWYHNIAIDNQENIYVTDILGNKIQKFEKIKQIELNKTDS